MENIELLKQINKIQQILLKKGIDAEQIIDELKKLREFFIEEKMPRIVKLIRLTYEHLENYETFNIAIPEDEGSDAEEELSVEEQRVESLSYLIALLQKPTQKLNAEDIDYYIDAFKTYAENN